MELQFQKKLFLRIMSSVNPILKLQATEKLILHIFRICQIYQKRELAII